jgi:hypothetical protein
VIELGSAEHPQIEERKADMPTKALINRERIGNKILQSSRTHAREVGERLNESLQFTVEEGETFADFVDLQHQLGRLLRLRLDELVAAEDAHFGEIDDDQEPRLLRQQAADALYTKLVELRELLRGFYGLERASSLVGISGETPDDPLTLHRQAASVLERLREPGPELPPQRFGSAEVDRNALADELQPFVDELGRILGDIERDVREREVTKGLRDRALAAFDSTARSVARIQRGLDELAGFPEYAARIRRSLPSRTGRSSETGEEPSQKPRLPDGTEDELSGSTETSVAGLLVAGERDAQTENETAD